MRGRTRGTHDFHNKRLRRSLGVRWVVSRFPVSLLRLFRVGLPDWSFHSVLIGECFKDPQQKPRRHFLLVGY